MESLLIKIGSWLVTPFIFLASLLNPTVEAPIISEPIPIVEEVNVGATLPQATGAFETTLQAPITATATSMTLNTNVVRGGGTVSGYTCFTIDQGSAQAEVVCGSVSTTAVTSMTRGISYADGVSSVTANKFAHRRGANIKITDFPIIQILKAQNNGDATFPNPLTYETGIGPVASSDLTDKEYVLSVVSGGTVSHDQEIITATAGETVAAGNLVYFDETQNEWMKTDADTLATIYNTKLGIALGSGTDGNTITSGVLVSGSYTTSGLTKGDLVYAGNTAGAFVSGTVGTVPRVIGVAKDSTTLNFDPNFQNDLYNYAVDAVGTDSYAATFAGAYNAYYVGMKIAVKVATANTGACSMNINGLGAKTIKKNVTDDMVTGDILANQIITLRYDGTNFQIMSPLTNNITPIVRTYLNAASPATWTKPTGLKYIVVEVQAVGGAGANGVDSGSSGNAGASGGAGGYSKKLIVAATLGSTETVTIGTGANPSSFGSHASATAGTAAVTTTRGVGGTGSSGDINVRGGDGTSGSSSTTTGSLGGPGGNSFFGAGGGGGSDSIDATAGGAYGAGGGGGGGSGGGNSSGGAGGPAIVIITEYY